LCLPESDANHTFATTYEQLGHEQLGHSEGSVSQRDKQVSDKQVQGVLVEIFGEQYRIGGEPKQVQQVAAYVDTKMKEIADKSPRMPKAQVAMLAAMEVAADLFKVMSERKVFTERAHESVERLTRLVEDRASLAEMPGHSADDDVPRVTDRVSNGLGARTGARTEDRLESRQSTRLPESAPVE
jgi:cell division protein ZapA